MPRYITDRARPGLIAFYNIQPRNGNSQQTLRCFLYEGIIQNCRRT